MNEIEEIIYFITLNIVALNKSEEKEIAEHLEKYEIRKK